MIEQKLNDEIIDSLCPFIKSAFKLIELDNKNEYTYAYLLLLASGIERLQKIIYILYELDINASVPSEKKLKKLSHDISKTYVNNIKPYFKIEDIFQEEENLINKSLEIITEIVTTLRYANFDFMKQSSFDIPSHIVKILDVIHSKYESNIDYENISKSIISIILQKYIAFLVYLIWHKKVGYSVNVHPICLQRFITEGYIEGNLNEEIQSIIDTANQEARDRK